MRDSESNANTKIYFEVRATVLHPRLHIEGFLLHPHKTFHKGTSTEELQLNTGNAQLLSQTQSTLYKRKGIKPNAKEKENKT